MSKGIIKPSNKLIGIDSSGGESLPAPARKISRGFIKQRFLEFRESELPDLGAYSVEHRYAVTEVFSIVKRPALVKPENMSESEFVREFIFPIGRVLAVGSFFSADFELKRGDYVRLRDNDVKTFYNPRYEKWVNNEYSKSNLKQVGQTPPEMVGNIHQAFGRKEFGVDIFELEFNVGDYIYALDPGNILMPIDDLDKIIKDQL